MSIPTQSTAEPILLLEHGVHRPTAQQDSREACDAVDTETCVATRAGVKGQKRCETFDTNLSHVCYYCCCFRMALSTQGALEWLESRYEKHGVLLFNQSHSGWYSLKIAVYTYLHSRTAWPAPSSLWRENHHQSPWSNIAWATLLKPAMFAPATSEGSSSPLTGT